MSNTVTKNGKKIEDAEKKMSSPNDDVSKCCSCIQNDDAFTPFSCGNIKKIAIVYTFKCSASCDHCCFKCTPSYELTLGFERALKCIDEAAIKNCKHIEFTGGECLLFSDEIIQLVQKVTSLGLNAGLVTNAYWATSPETARKIVESLANAGLKNMIISADPFHQKFVPLHNVFCAINELLEYKIKVQVNMQRSGLRDKECNKIWREINTRIEGKPVGVKVSEVGPYGRWRKHRYKLPHDFKEQIDVCKSVFELSVFPNGDVFPCCSGAVSDFFDHEDLPNFLRLGNVNKNSLQKIIEKAMMSPFLNALRIVGPNGLLDIWGDGGFIHEDFPLFCGTCDLCIATSKELGERFPNLANVVHQVDNDNIRSRLLQSWDERTKLLPDP
jgi:MoaA/NifB/PqqE/SkfB family radical SAM enzyme